MITTEKTATSAAPHINGASRRVPSSMAGTLLRTEPIRITPEFAKKWLGANTDSNRSVSTRTVEAYAADMRAGRWLLTHQGIAFNQTGELVDGQHRLHAIVAAGVPIDMMVTSGLPLEYNSPIDQGYNRSAAHILGRNTRWVSVVRALLVLESGLTDTSFKSTVGLLEACAARHAAAIDACLTIAKSARANPSGHVAVMAYAYPTDINKVSSFAREVESGELLAKGDPAYTLRKWIAKGRHTPRETMLASIGAVRYALTGKKMATIYAGVGSTERDGMSNYVWLVQRRRGAKVLEGTPSVDVVTNKRETETDG